VPSAQRGDVGVTPHVLITEAEQRSCDRGPRRPIAAVAAAPRSGLDASHVIRSANACAPVAAFADP
jgi:hypothetical protein